MTARPLETDFLKVLTVLYVEDEPHALEEISTFLRRRVGKLITASQGEEGLAAFRSEHPALVVTDIQMPIMDGLAMAKAMRDLDPSVPIIVTTAFEQTDYLLRSLELGIDHYVLKPVQAARLESALLACAARLLAEDQMRQKQRLEAEVLRMRHQTVINTLLGGIGHDYNNLLQAILATHDLALACADPGSKVQRILKASAHASEQARLLSRRLMALVNPAYQLQQVGPIEGLLRSTVEAGLAGTLIRMEFDFQAGDPVVRHDRAALQQALASLVVNAREAMPSGGMLQFSTRTLQISGPDAAGLPQGHYLHMLIRDSGRGIAAEDLPMIFEPYFTTKERSSQRGTGLGLALCETIIHAHGGSISAESTPGQGATFTVLLPLA